MTYPSADEGSTWRAGTSESGLDRLSTRQPAVTNLMEIARLGAPSPRECVDDQVRLRAWPSRSQQHPKYLPSNWHSSPSWTPSKPNGNGTADNGGRLGKAGSL